MKFQRDSSPIVDIHPDALERIRGLAAASIEQETGGILVGFNSGLNIEIILASDAGPNAQSSAAHFLRDTDYCRRYLTEQYAKNGTDYVGEWHSHVMSLRRLSSGDLQTVAGMFVDPDYDFLTFAIVLVVVAEGAPELHVYVAQRGNDRRRVCLQITELYSGSFPSAS
jgi:proteasome lid subunit RPN8/RPN11